MLGASVQVRGLSKSYADHSVLTSLDFEQSPGEFVAVVGKSGCGKSTLLRLLAGLEKPTSGDVLLDGKPLQGLNTSARVMFQDARLLPWKRVSDNVALGLPTHHKQDAEDALRAVGLSDRRGDWPAILSGGQRQRVALARALASHPRFLLFDEPLSALDALTRLEMQSLIEHLWLEHGFTSLLITHDVEEAVALADRVILVEHGSITLNLPVPLPRPRRRDSPAFVAMREEVLSRIKSSEPNSPIPHRF